MKTPREKYYNDPLYHRFTDYLVSLLNEAHFTPSEVREISLLACIIYEEHRFDYQPVPGPMNQKLEEALRTISEWSDLYSGMGKDGRQCE